MRIKLLLLALVVLLLVALLWQYDHESESEGRVVVAFYMVANQKLEEDIAEDYQEIVEGSYNCSGVIYVAYQSCPHLSADTPCNPFSPQSTGWRMWRN